MGVAIAVSVVWGVAEATLFFIVPDVYLTFLAIRGKRIALVGCAAAVAGALVGGAIMYRWGALDQPGVEAVFDRVPAIDDDMVVHVRESVERSGLGAVFLGPVSGTPYKIYAAEAGSLGLSLVAFLLISVPARGVRFVAIALLTSWLARGPLGKWTTRRQYMLAASSWGVFYVLYFSVKGV